MQKSFLLPLSASDEAEYLKRLACGDLSAKSVLIERNMRLVAHIAKKYRNPDEDMDDLISIGTIGLIKAVSTFNPDRAIKLGTYAARCIENELLMYFRRKKKTGKDVSLYEPIGTDKEGNQITLADVVESPEGALWDKVILKKDVGLLYALIPDVLTERERYIICHRYGLYNKKPDTQRMIAEQLGISRSYVSRIEKRAILKLRRAFLTE